MDTAADTGEPKGSEVKSSLMDDFLVGMARKPLYAIHPRRSNRTVTMWKGAVTVKEKDLLPAVFKVMHEENILSCPVVNENDRFSGQMCDELNECAIDTVQGSLQWRIS